MPTVYGNIVNSNINGGWRSTVSYSIIEEDATSVIVSVYDIGFIAVRTSTSWFDCTGSSSQTLKVGSNTVTNRKFELNDYFLGDDRVGVLWYSSKSGSTIYVLSYQIPLAKGHAETTQSITASIALGSGWTMYDDVSWTERTISGTSSISIPISVPALTSYTVTLDAQGGTGVPETLTKWHGEELALPQPSMSGYEFAGWALSSAPTIVVYEPGDSYVINVAASLVAVWTPIISAVYIESLTAVRADSEGNPAEDGECAIIECAWRVEGAKAATVAVSASIDTMPTWTVTDTEAKQGGETLRETSTWFVSGGRLDVATRYTAEVSVVSDGVSASMSENIGIAFITIDVLAGGKGIAFGKAAETEELFEVGNMDVSFERDLHVGGDTDIDGDTSVTGDVTSAGTVGGAIVESAGGLYMYGVHLANCFSCLQVSTTIGAVAGSSTKTFTIDATRTGYRAIAISGYYIYGAATLHPYMLRLNGTNVECYLRNNLTTATSASAILYVQVLYIRTGGSSDSQIYDGAYNVTPRVYEQTLDTDGKRMLDDVTVEVIPVARVSNEQGGETATIGE